MSDRTYYAIGDIHGEDDRLAQLHEYIFEDAQRRGVKPFIVHVGDLVDRGPNSRGVIKRIMALETSSACDCVTVMGNHEQLMLTAYDRAETTELYHWKVNGGDVTVISYERANGAHDDWRTAIDREHIAWLRALPTIWRDEDRKLAFVHAGIDPKTFPACDDEIRLWTRSLKFFDPGRWPKRAETEGLLVIHGHTPTDDFAPHVDRRRINVDTGACYGGPLTCVVLAPNESPRFLYVQSSKQA